MTGSHVCFTPCFVTLASTVVILSISEFAGRHLARKETVEYFDKSTVPGFPSAPSICNAAHAQGFGMTCDTLKSKLSDCRVTSRMRTVDAPPAETSVMAAKCHRAAPFSGGMIDRDGLL